jgi:hypothetical protein
VRTYPDGKPRPGDPKPIIKVGQDEKTFAAFAYPSWTWRVGGVIQLRPKTEGPKEMVSGFVSRLAPFGFPLTQRGPEPQN